MQKIAAPLVGAPFCGDPVRPNMLNMPKSAADSMITAYREQYTPKIPTLVIIFIHHTVVEIQKE